MAIKSRTKIQHYALEGGLDVVTPAISVKSGKALAMFNFEPWYLGGYRRVAGYERFDGRPKPSDATFTGFDVDDITGLVIGDTITGDTSSTTGILIGIWDDDGSYGSDAIAVTKVSGAGFSSGETCNTAAFTIGSTAEILQAPTDALQQAWLLQAETEYRDDIAVVPGANQVRGTWQRLGDNYAIRDNVGVTAGILHKASTAGWTTTGITMADYVLFNAGLAAGASAVVGGTLTGGTSGATATIHKIILNGGSGAWDGSGEGYFVLTGVAGGPFTTGEALQTPGTTPVATADGGSATFAFPTGGAYRFINHNFFGSSTSYRAYGVNGVGAAFEIDESGIVTFILMPGNAIPSAGSPPSTNTPFLIEEHRGHLFLMFPGGSLQHSLPGEPLNFSGFLGAGEFGLGDEGTSLNSVVGNVLIVSTRRETRGLYGTSVADWDLRIVAEQTGSILNASQKIDTVYSLDDLGISSVSRSDQFGDFISATVSQQIQPMINKARENFTDSTVVRSSNQIRFYFNDNSCIIMYVPAGSQTSLRSGSGDYAFSQFGYIGYNIPVINIYNTDDASGKERTYFVTNDATYQGYVFEDQIGKNLDGEVIKSYVRTVFNQTGSPAYRKFYRRADLELNVPSQLRILLNTELSYAGPESPTANVDLEVLGGGDFWDVGYWDEFIWDGQAITTARASLSGTGENIGFLIYNETATSDPWVMQGITLHYDMRRLQR